LSAIVLIIKRLSREFIVPKLPWHVTSVFRGFTRKVAPLILLRQARGIWDLSWSFSHQQAVSCRILLQPITMWEKVCPLLVEGQWSLP
jgi:hypothetical protein